jgi:hypothetical protein
VRDDRLGVFFPALMGVGILVSGAVLVMDWVKKLLPSGGVRRQHRIVTTGRNLAFQIAVTAGHEVNRPPIPKRVWRATTTYLAAAGVFTTAGVFLAAAAFQSNDIAGRHLYRSVWMEALGIMALSFFGLLVLAVLLPVFVRPGKSPAVNWLVSETAVGKLVPPPSDPASLLERKEDAR